MHRVIPPLLAIALLGLTTLPARATDIEWRPSWKADDKAGYDVKRCRKADGPRPVDACTTGKIEILVLRADEKGSVQRWQSEVLGDGLSRLGLSTDLAELLGKASRTPVDIEFNQLVQPVRLVNAKEVRAMFESVIDAVTTSSAVDKHPKAAAAVKSLVAQLVSTDDKLLALSIKDPSVIYSPLGGVFPLGETVRVRSSMPSPFGATPIQSTMSITTHASDPASRDVRMTIDEEVDRAVLDSLVDAMIKPMLQQAGGQPEVIEEVRKAMSSMTIKRSSRYQVRLDSSWPLSVVWNQSIEGAGRHRTETVEFTRTH